MNQSKFKADMIFGSIAVLIGIVCVAECFRLIPIASSSLSGDHIMPGITGGALILLGLLMLIRPGKKTFSVSFPQRETALRMCGSFAILIIYCILINFIGFAASTLICGIFLFRLFGGYSWIKCILASLATGVGLYIVFIYALGMSFPRGIWG